MTLNDWSGIYFCFFSSSQPPSPLPLPHFGNTFAPSFRIRLELVASLFLDVISKQRCLNVAVRDCSCFEKLTRISHFLFYCSMFSLIFVFVYGRLLSQIVTDLSKLTVGRLSPGFLAACNANLTEAGCQGYVIRYKGSVHRGSF